MKRPRRVWPITLLMGAIRNGWILLLIPFCIAFTETWLQLQIYHDDYAAATLTQQIQELRDEVQQLKAQEADLEAMRRLEDIAPQLGLKEPDPRQIVVLDANELAYPPADEKRAVAELRGARALAE